MIDARRALALLIRRNGAALLVAGGFLGFSAVPASAEIVTQRVNLGQGTIKAPAGTWKATAVPVGSLLVDLYDRSGLLRQTYGAGFRRSLPARALKMTGMRPEGLPSRQAIVMGATGRQIRKVRIFIRGGGRRVVRTVAAPRDWSIKARFFAVAYNVRASQRRALKAATKIQGLNRRGRVVKTLRGRKLNFGAS